MIGNARLVTTAVLYNNTSNHDKRALLDYIYILFATWSDRKKTHGNSRIKKQFNQSLNWQSDYFFMEKKNGTCFDYAHFDLLLTTIFKYVFDFMKSAFRREGLSGNETPLKPFA